MIEILLAAILFFLLGYIIATIRLKRRMKRDPYPYLSRSDRVNLKFAYMPHTDID